MKTSIFQRVSVLALHLSWERVDDGTSWRYPDDYPELVDDLMELFQQFVDALAGSNSIAAELLATDLQLSRVDRRDIAGRGRY